MGQNADAPSPAPQTDADYSDAYLLRRYVRHESQAAFAALVRRYSGLVHATCLREVDDPQLAENAAQVVFLLLARKGPSLLRADSLAGWLFRAARFSARNALRQERRRKIHEQAVIADMTQAHRNGPPLPSWDFLEPLLNAALASLRPHEQDVILLRYLEGKSWRETAARLGLAEDAAQKRGTRRGQDAPVRPPAGPDAFGCRPDRPALRRSRPCRPPPGGNNYQARWATRPARQHSLSRSLTHHEVD